MITTNDLDSTVEFHGIEITAHANSQCVSFAFGAGVAFTDLEEFFDACREARDETLRKIAESQRSDHVDLIVKVSQAIAGASALYETDMARAEEIIDRLSAAGYAIVRKDIGK